MALFENRFSQLRNENQTVMSPAEALAAISLISITIDGYCSDEEVLGLIASLNRMKLFRSYSNDVMRKLFDRSLFLIKRDGFSRLLQSAVSSLPRDLHETAFAVVSDLVLADGEVTQEEEDLLGDLYRALDLSEEVASKIVDVMLIKNKG
jgi:tellurite resistance protein